MTSFAQTVSYLAWHLIVGAVLAVFKENEHHATISGWEPDDDSWSINTDQRQDLFKRVKEAWCRLAKRDFTQFPYNTDYVVLLYRRIAQRSAKRRNKLEKEIDAASQS